MSLPTRAGWLVLPLLLLPGTILHAQDRTLAECPHPFCPHFTVAISSAGNLTRKIGDEVFVAAWIADQSPGCYTNAEVKYPRFDAHWEVTGIQAEPQQGAGLLAYFKCLSPGDGTVKFFIHAGPLYLGRQLVCEQTEAPALEFQVQMPEVDLDVDSDHDRDIDDADDPIEVSDGGWVWVNSDDDNGNGIPDRDDPGPVSQEDDLVAVTIRLDPSPLHAGALTLSVLEGASRIKVWSDPNKSTPITLPITWNLETNQPLPTLYLEGLHPSASPRDVTLRLRYSAGDEEREDDISLTILQVEIAMDGNRDDVIDFDDPDDAHYLFWVNNDYDLKHQNEEIWQQDDDNPATHHDYDDNYIGNSQASGEHACERDLEDFTRLHLRVDNTAANLSGITYWLKFDNVTSGSPAVNVFEAVDASSDYVSDSGVAAQQIQKQNLTPSGVGTTEVQIDAQYIKTGNEVSPFIIEGRSAGKGDLTFIVKKDGNAVCRKAVTLELQNMPWFYDIYSVGVTSGDRWEVHIPTTATHSQTASYSPATDEKFLLVHGWNMTEAEKTQWTETVFKRLWWQGYQGSVALFSWPTLSDMNFWDVVSGGHHFDNSEFRSWLSKDALSGLLNALNSDGKLRVLAHSMGNVVFGQALRDYSGPDVHTYFACQAALSAHYYDNAVAATSPASHWVYLLWFPISTPDIFGHYHSGDANTVPYFADNDTRVGNMANYYNPLDWALNLWEMNNIMKPAGLTPYLFGYAGRETVYEEGVGRFSRGPIDDPYEVLSVTDARQRFMIFAY